MQDSQNSSPGWHGTTILTVRKGGKVVVGGDGQVSIGQTVIKSNAKKVRKLGKGDVIGGFAGAFGGMGMSYFAGSPLHPANFATDWNRSFVLTPDGPPKGAAVLAMTGFHMWLARQRRALSEGRGANGRTYRMMNEVPTLLMVVIVLSVIVKF